MVNAKSKGKGKAGGNVAKLLPEPPPVRVEGVDDYVYNESHVITNPEPN